MRKSDASQPRRETSEESRTGRCARAASVKSAVHVKAYGKEILGERVIVQWDGEGLRGQWYAGKIKHWNQTDDRHLVVYDDGDTKWHNVALEELQGLETLEPGSTLEALVVHAHLVFLLEDRPDDRAALAALVQNHGHAALPLPEAEGASDFEHAAMFHGMFKTACEMAAAESGE